MEHSQQLSPQSVPEQTGDAARPRNAGRKKIRIIRINDNRSRQVTFLKRKNGLLKKAHELSILCGCNVAVVIFNNDNGKLYEYFNPSAEETFQRYAVYTGVSERRRSDVMDLEEAKGSCDIPNEEPEVAEAALAAATMSAIRHANPENYVYPPPGRPQIHPNVTVPAIRMPPPPAPVHQTLGASSSRRSVAGPSNRPVLVHTPNTDQATPVSRTPTSAIRARDSENRNYSLTVAGTPQVTRSFPFRLGEQAFSPRTAENQISACFGLPQLAPNEQSQQRENKYRQALDIEPETRNRENTFGSLHASSNLECDGVTPELVSRDGEIGAEGIFAEGQAAFLNAVPPADMMPIRLPGVEMPTSNQHLESALFANCNFAQASPPPTVSRQSGPPIASTAPRAPAEQPWNTPFFQQQMQEPEQLEIRTVLPPLNPLLGYLPNSEAEFNALNTDADNLLNQAGFDALPGPSDADIIPLSIVDPVNSNRLPPMGTTRNRGGEASWGEDRVRKRQRLDG